MKPQGSGRFFRAAFLAVWLMGWAVGEFFALWILGWGVWQVVSTGQPPEKGGFAGWGGVLGAAVFMAVWLTIWTIGGLSAMREFLRSVWSEDRFILNGGGLKIVHCWGPFANTQFIPRDHIQRFGLIEKGRVLVAYDEDEPLRLSDLGRPEERRELLCSLEEKLVLSAGKKEALESNLSAEYRETVSPDGQMVLVKNPAHRLMGARILAGLALILLSGAAAIILRHGWLSEFLAGAVVLSLFGLWAAGGGIWLAWYHYEWSFGPGRLVLRRRFRGQTKEILQAGALILQSSTDDDGDEWFTLRAITASESSEPRGWTASPPGRDLLKLIHDAQPVRAFGHWLAQRTGLPFYDRTTPEAQQAELEKAREQLAGQGAVGRWALTFLDRIKPPRKG